MASIALALTGTVVLGGAAPAAAAEVCTVANPMGAATPTGSTDGYTIFVTENAILANSELEGTLAVGGTATFGDSRGNQNNQYPIFHGGAGGNANYNVPTIDGGPNRVSRPGESGGSGLCLTRSGGDGFVQRSGRPRPGWG